MRKYLVILVLPIILTVIGGMSNSAFCFFDPLKEIRDRTINSYDEEIDKARRWAPDDRISQIVDAIEALAYRVSLLEEKNKTTGKQ